MSHIARSRTLARHGVLHGKWREKALLGDWGRQDKRDCIQRSQVIGMPCRSVRTVFGRAHAAADLQAKSGICCMQQPWPLVGGRL